MANIMKCTLCNSHNTIIKSEKVDDFFDGELFIYDEVYTECEDCGFEFVSAEQSTANLKSRFAGKVDVQEQSSCIISQSLYLYQEIGELISNSFSPIYGLESLNISSNFFFRETRKTNESLNEVPVVGRRYNPCYTFA